jgi:hypothetical protein
VPSAAAAAEAVMPAAAGEASAAAREAAATQNLLRDLGVAAGGETASKPPRAPMTEAEAALVIQRQLRMRTAKRHVRARAKRKAVRDAILAVEAATHHQPPRRRRHGAAQASGGEAPKHDARRRRHARGATEAAEGQQAGAKHGAAGAWESEQACAALRVRHAAAEAEVAALRGATEERQAEERDGAVARRRAQREQAKAQRGAAGEWEAARAEAAAVERACAALQVRHAAVSERAEAEREAASRRLAAQEAEVAVHARRGRRLEAEHAVEVAALRSHHRLNSRVAGDLRAQRVHAAHSASREAAVQGLLQRHGRLLEAGWYAGELKALVAGAEAHTARQASPRREAEAERGAAGELEAARAEAKESEQACAALRVRHAAAEAEVAALRGAMDGQRRQPGAKHMEDTQEADHRQATQEAAEERRREHALVLADQQERATAGAVEHQAALQRLQADMERREDSAARRLRLLERRAERDRRVWGDEHADEMGQMQEQVPPRAAVARATRLALHFRRPSDASLPPGRCIAVAECRKQPSPPDGDGMTLFLQFTTVDRLQFLILAPVQPSVRLFSRFLRLELAQNKHPYPLQFRYTPAAAAAGMERGMGFG